MRHFPSAMVLIIALGMLFSGSSSRCFQAPTTEMANTVVKLEVSDDIVEPGEDFTIFVVIEPAAGANIAGAQFDLEFNPRSIEVQSVLEGPFLKQSDVSTFFNSGNIDNDAGYLSSVFGVVLGAGVICPEARVFANIHCIARSVPSTSAFVLRNVIVGNTAGTSVPLESLTPVQVVVALFGDVNKDGVISVQDLEAIADVFSSSGEPGWLRADIDLDGVVTVLDAIHVGQLIEPSA